MASTAGSHGNGSHITAVSITSPDLPGSCTLGKTYHSHKRGTAITASDGVIVQFSDLYSSLCLLLLTQTVLLWDVTVPYSDYKTALCSLTHINGYA